MKKLALAALAAMPALAGTPADVPAVTLTPAPAASPWSADLAAVYRYQLNDAATSTTGVNTIGADLTLNYAVTEADYINVRFGYSFGNEKWFSNDGSLEADRHTFYIMPGYKHVWTVTEKTKVFAGANAGVANISEKSEVKVAGKVNDKNHDSDWGFAYSAEAGASYEFCPNWAAFGAVEFFGATATPFPHLGIKQPVYTGVRFGVSHQF